MDRRTSGAFHPALGGPFPSVVDEVQQAAASAALLGAQFMAGKAAQPQDLGAISGWHRDVSSAFRLADQV